MLDIFQFAVACNDIVIINLGKQHPVNFYTGKVVEQKIHPTRIFKNWYKKRELLRQVTNVNPSLNIKII